MGHYPVLSQGNEATGERKCWLKWVQWILQKLSTIIILFHRYSKGHGFFKLSGCIFKWYLGLKKKAKSKKVCEILIHILAWVADSHQNFLFLNKM